MRRSPPRPATAQRRRVRVIGFGLGALIGGLETVILLVAGLVSGIASGASTGAIFGPDGFFAPDRGARFVWAVLPIAASVAGLIVAPWAQRRARWAGMAMGFATYLVGIVIGPLFVLVLPSLGAAPTVGSSAITLIDGLLSLVFGIGVLWLIGAVLLAPLLLACVLAGIAWAALLRRVVGGAPEEPAGSGSTSTRTSVSPPAGTPLVDAPLVAMVVIASVLGLLWLVLVAVLQVLADAQLD